MLKRTPTPEVAHNFYTDADIDGPRKQKFMPLEDASYKF